jgi:hypothetical protein
LHESDKQGEDTADLVHQQNKPAWSIREHNGRSMDSAAERTMSGERNDPAEAEATTGTTRSNAIKNAVGSNSE